MPKLFVIMPFGVKSGHPAYDGAIDFDMIYVQIIKSASEMAGWTVLRIDELAQPGLITNQYLRAISEADMVLADISMPNANVFYELGIRQAISTGGTILIALKGSTIPFDLSSQRVLFYSLSDEGIELAKQSIIQSLTHYEGTSFVNPIRLFLESIGATPNPKADTAAFERELMGRIERARNADQLVAIWAWAQNLSPLPPLPLLVLAERLSNFHEWHFSVEVLRAAVKQRPNDFEIHRQLGWHLRHLGPEHEEEALASLQRTLDLNHGDPETLGMMGGIYKRQGRYAEAFKYYNQGAKISPHSLYMLVNQAAMRVLSDPANAESGVELYRELAHYIESQKDTPPDEWSELVLGEALFAIGDVDGAKKHFAAGCEKATSPKGPRSAADQLELLARAGFRKQEAEELANWLRQKATGLISDIRIRDTDGEVQIERAESAAKERDLPILVHLSDLHFGSRPDRDGNPVNMHRFYEGDYSKSLSHHIIDELSQQCSRERIHLIISGDLIYTGAREEFELAKKCLEEICEGLKIDKSRVTIIPGNHDVNWNLEKVHLSQRFDHYISFLANFYTQDLFRKKHPKI